MWLLFKDLWYLYIRVHVQAYMYSTLKKPNIHVATLCLNKILFHGPFKKNSEKGSKVRTFICMLQTCTCTCTCNCSLQALLPCSHINVCTCTPVHYKCVVNNVGIFQRLYCWLLLSHFSVQQC